MTSLLLASALGAIALAGCGGGPNGPVPDVVGKRLDVAKRTIDAAGYGTEELGGGMFGVVEEANWVVCDTEPTAGATTDSDVKLIVDRSCAGERDTAAVAEDVVDEPRVEAPAARRVRVPDVVGMDHQAAQNRMQDAGLFNLRERDATGAGRMLIWDRNWVVVDQQPAAGSRVGEDRKVLLYAVKDGEL